jgi:hypothetical protein
MLIQLYIALLSYPNNVWFRSLGSQCFVCSQNVLFERYEASQPSMHVSHIIPRIFCTMLQSSCNFLISILVIYVVVIRPYAIHMFPQPHTKFCDAFMSVSLLPFYLKLWSIHIIQSRLNLPLRKLSHHICDWVRNATFNLFIGVWNVVPKGEGGSNGIMAGSCVSGISV